MKTTDKRIARVEADIISKHVTTIAKRAMSDGAAPLDGNDVIVNTAEWQAIEAAIGRPLSSVERSKVRQDVRAEIDLHPIA
jgi:hypothetical protein